MKAFDEFMLYKQRVPVRGAILLNEAMDSAVLVRGWKSGSGWSFPRGKINMDEDDLDCAIREVDEEIGFDIRKAGLVPRDDEVKFIEVTMKGQQVRLYVFRNVPMDTYFEPKTRKEISKISWYKLSELPGIRRKGNNGETDVTAAPINNNKFYMVAPFIAKLKGWIAQQKKRGGGRPTPTSYASSSYLGAQATLEEPLTEEDPSVQTDTAAEEPAPAPSIDIEEANKTLQQLLNLQPPTQGLQLGSSSTVESIDKGSALMALLQGSDSSAHHSVQHSIQHLAQHSAREPQQPVPAGNSQVPHTPFDHVYTNAPQPNTPHHHHPTQLIPPNSYQAPPNFPLAQHANQNQAFSQNQPFSQQQHFNQQQYLNQNQPSNYQYPPNRNAQVPVPNYYNNYVPNHSQQMQQQYMNQQRMNPMGPHRQPQKAPEILHPQPLPPQAQSILTRSMLPTPQLPETNVNAGGSTTFQGQMATMENQLANASQGRVHMQQRPVNQPPAQMNSHTMSLLSAFKTGPTRSAEPQANPVSQGQAAQNPVMALQDHYQQAPGPWPHASQSAGRQQGPPHLSSVPAMANMQQQPNGVAKPVSFDGPPPAQHHQLPQPDTHRSALLDMFKKQAPLSPASGSDATVKPAKPVTERPVRNPVFSPAAAAAQPQSTAQAIAVAASPQANGGPVVMNPELNLPFRATQILSRPKQGENMPSDKQHGANGHVPHAVTQKHREARHAAPLSATSVNQPAVILQAANAYNAPQSRGQAFNPQASNAPYNHTQHSGPLAASPKSFPGAGMLHGRQEGNPEQAKKLLSLFGKPQPSPTGLSADDKGKMKETSMMDQPRSRMASLSHASASGDGAQNGGSSTSRRGSATPISPSDRDFLLNYLASVTKQGL